MAMPKGGSRTMKPTVVKFQNGTINTTRQNKLEPKNTHPGIPNAPPYLTPAEQESWERFADALYTSMKVLTKEDFASFEALVCIYEETKRLRQALRDDPSITVSEPKFNKQGEVVGEVVKARPEWSLLNSADQRLRQWLGCFGLTPGDRGRVQTWEGQEGASGKKAPEDEFGTGT